MYECTDTLSSHKGYSKGYKIAVIIVTDNYLLIVPSPLFWGQTTPYGTFSVITFLVEV